MPVDPHRLGMPDHRSAQAIGDLRVAEALARRLKRSNEQAAEARAREQQLSLMPSTCPVLHASPTLHAEARGVATARSAPGVRELRRESTATMIRAGARIRRETAKTLLT